MSRLLKGLGKLSKSSWSQNNMIGRIVFHIEGPLLGYRASVKRAHDPKYKAFKQEVRLIANTAGVPDEIPKQGKAYLQVDIFWKRKPRIDGANVYKAIEDALFVQDRRVFYGHFMVEEDRGFEGARVTVDVQ